MNLKVLENNTIRRSLGQRWKYSHSIPGAETMGWCREGYTPL